MKRSVIITIVLVAALLASGTAYAESLLYNPASYKGEAETGTTISIPFSVTVNGIATKAVLIFVDSVKNGNMPANWLSAQPGNAQVNAVTPTAGTNLSISVPADTAPGTYTASVLSSVSDGTSPGNGSYIIIDVKEAKAACSESPDIKVSSVSPKSVNSPNNRPVDVTITGSIGNPDGCSSARLSYQVADEYGVANTSGSFNAEKSGEFNVTVPIVASRSGNDKDGRTFDITLTADNEAGTSAITVNVNVLHDRR